MSNEDSLVSQTNKNKNQEPEQSQPSNIDDFESLWSCFSRTIRTTFPVVIFYLKGSTLELIVVLYIFAIMIQSLALPQMIQDKICLQFFANQTSTDYCRMLSIQPNSPVKEPNSKILLKGF